MSMLLDKTYDLKDNGRVKTVKKFPPLQANIRFTIDILGKLLNENWDKNFVDPGWNQFLAAITIRNRITHPKSNSDYEITDRDMETCLDSLDWFIRATNPIMALVAKKLREDR